MDRCTWIELADLLLAYCASFTRGRAAQRLYRDIYPNRWIPHHMTFSSIHRRLCQSVTVHRWVDDQGRGYFVQSPEAEEAVLQYIENNPSVSTRDTALSHESCHNLENSAGNVVASVPPWESSCSYNSWLSIPNALAITSTSILCQCVGRDCRWLSSGPYILPELLNANTYLIFLQNVLPELFHPIPLNIRRSMQFQHDGAPPHFGNAVHGRLTAT